jgi:hypothetical protein
MFVFLYGNWRGEKTELRVLMEMKADCLVQETRMLSS